MAVDLEYYGVPPADYIQLSNRTRLTAASGQTTFPAPYTVGYVDVYYNGAKLDPYTEFTATDGANVILTSAASATGDIVEVISQAQVALTNTYTQQQVNALTSMYYGVCTGTGDAQVLVTTPTFTAYSDGMMVRCRAIAANTSTTPTIAINGLAAITIVSNNSQGALYGNDFTANNELTLRYVQAINKFVLVDGGVTQQTQAQFDNSNRIATTAFVKTAGMQASAVTNIGATASLTAANMGQLIYAAGGSPFTLTLPSLASCPAGSMIYFQASQTVTVQRAGSDAMFLNSAGGTTSVTLASGDTLTLMAWPGTGWISPGNSGQLALSSVFSSSLSTSGYQKLPSGLIIQKGQINCATANTFYAFTFPITFPTSGSNTTVIVTPISGGGTALSAWHNTPNSTSVSVACSAIAFVDIIAIGY